MIALITPTGCREKQIALCAKFMKSQDYTGEVLWVIVDDAYPVTSDCITEDFREGWKIVKIYPTPIWRMGNNTQSRNLIAGLNVVLQFNNVSAVFIIEDDDYYTNTYLTNTLAELQGFVACGEVCTIYANVSDFWIHRYKNMLHSSLFQTAFIPEIIPIFKEITTKHPKFIDMKFWAKLLEQKMKVNLFEKNVPYSIGIKGMPGRPGIGKGHKKGLPNQNPIEGILALKKLLGFDYLNYL